MRCCTCGPDAGAATGRRGAGSTSAHPSSSSTGEPKQRSLQKPAAARRVLVSSGITCPQRKTARPLSAASARAPDSAVLVALGALPQRKSALFSAKSESSRGRAGRSMPLLPTTTHMQSISYVKPCAAPRRARHLEKPMCVVFVILRFTATDLTGCRFVRRTARGAWGAKPLRTQPFVHRLQTDRAAEDLCVQLAHDRQMMQETRCPIVEAMSPR